MEACRRACEIENEILCRSFLYRGPPTGTAYNCQLFHLDHVTLPEGPLAYLSPERPLIDTGREAGVYYENVCKSEWRGGIGGRGVMDGIAASLGDVYIELRSRRFAAVRRVDLLRKPTAGVLENLILIQTF